MVGGGGADWMRRVQPQLTAGAAIGRVNYSIAPAFPTAFLHTPALFYLPATAPAPQDGDLPARRR